MIEIVDHSEPFAALAAELILAIQRAEFGLDIRLDDQPDLLSVASFYQKGAGGFWLALSGSEVVGTIALRDIGNNQGALRKMFVKDTYRGKEHSVALRLLEHLVRWAASAHLTELFLGTTDKFTAAHRFYEKNGFVRVSPELLPVAFPRMPVDTRFYHRAIATK